MAHNNLGAALARKGQLDDAIDAYHEAIRLRPDLASARVSLGISLRNKGLLDQAIDTFREGIVLSGKKVAEKGDKNSRKELATFHNELGLVLTRADRHEEAVRAHRLALVLYEKLAADFPDVADYRDWVPKLNHNVGNALAQLAWQLATSADPMIRDPKRAAKLAKEALDINSNFGTAWNALGVMNYRGGDWKAAVSALEKAAIVNQTDQRYVRLVPETRCAAQFVLAMASWQLGNKVNARIAYEEAVQWMVKNQPKNENLRRFRAEAEELLKKGSQVRDQESEKK